VDSGVEKAHFCDAHHILKATAALASRASIGLIASREIAMPKTAFFIAEDATPRERRGRSVWRFFLDRITGPVITGAILAAAAAVAIPSSSVAASIGVALVENFTGISAGVEVMQYLQTGRTIRLGPHDTIVLTYLNSCIQETITGGSVTIGIDQSEVKTGEVKRTRLNCDVGNFLLSGQGNIAIAGRVFRGLKQKTSDLDVGR
jgi:hypothetical protein